MSKYLYCEPCDQVYREKNSPERDYPIPAPGGMCSDCGAKLVPYEFPKQVCARYTSAREMTEGTKEAE